MTEEQGLIVVTRDEFTYSRLRNLAVDVMKRLLEISQEEFDEYDMMCNFLARGTTCMGNMLLLRRSGEGDDDGMLGRHLMELLATASYVISEKRRVNAFRKYSHIQFEKAQNKFMQARKQNPGYSKEAFERSKHVLRIVRQRIARSQISKRDKSWQLPKKEILFTSPELSELIGGELDKGWYERLYYYPSMLYVHITAYTGGDDRELLLRGRSRPDRDGGGGHYMVGYYLLVVLALSVIGEDDSTFQGFGRVLQTLRGRLFSEDG